jgi:hypothetical protein
MLQFATVAMIATVMLTTSEALLCYQCNGVSGTSQISLIGSSTCGLPFLDNSTNPLTTVSCQGVCVTQIRYNGGTAGTDIRRACSDAPVTNICATRIDPSSSLVFWTCINTCNTDKCNSVSCTADKCV